MAGKGMRIGHGFPRFFNPGRFRSTTLLLAGSLGLTGVRADSASPAPLISAAQILERVKVLSSDEFEGRAPATPGEEKTIAYLTAEYKKSGLAPGNPNGSYLEDVPMVGITSKPSLSFAIGGKTINYAPINDYIAYSLRTAAHVEVKDSDLVFIGYGVIAPEFDWDDFKGVDVRGKTVVVLINDPPVRDPKDPAKLDPKVFGGNAMTYYGRWTYKYDLASARGAAACLIVHETGPAGYPFGVLVGSNTRENFDLRRPNGNAAHVAVEGWLTLNAAKALFAATGHDFAELKAAAARRDFHPVELGARANLTVENTVREVASHNVIARLDGSDPALRDEYVIYSAHWDHLGRDPRLQGDQIFNGAADNASGTAVLLGIAQAYAQLPPADRPKRTMLFLSVTAEEKGLLGSRYYAQNPLYPLNRTLADINMDGAQFIGPSRDLEVVGSGNSTIDGLAARLLAKSGRVLTPDSQPEKGSFYRSDHFEFAKVGVPSFYTKAGIDIIGRPAGYGMQKRDEYIALYYHKVGDEIQPWWDFSGAAEDARFLFELGREIADGTTWPEWNPGNEFKARRDQMMRP
jgi:Zn-dependent M28 family amino/carboxypeptidase